MTGFFEHQYLRYKKNHLKNLVAFAYVDGELHNSERNLLYSIGERYGLKGYQIAKIIENNKAFELDVPGNMEQRLDQIFDLVEMMLADGIIQQSEMNLCQIVAEEYGFKIEVVNAVIDLIKEGKSGRYQWKMFKDEAIPAYQA